MVLFIAGLNQLVMVLLVCRIMEVEPVSVCSCNKGIIVSIKLLVRKIILFFPSELPARPRFEAHSGDSRGNNSENLRVFEGLDGGKMRNISRPERIVWDIVSESVLIVSLTTQEFTGEVMASTQEYLKNLIENKKEELVSLQNRLEKRSDLTKDNLSKGNKVQL
ncbi:hypothetical protein RYX36_034233 [Vicia faba]